MQSCFKNPLIKKQYNEIIKLDAAQLADPVNFITTRVCSYLC